MLKIIAAVDDRNGIGVGNQLPWKLKDDLKRFKHLTSNSTIVMGRNTFESIGKPLENRLNIVISRQSTLSVAGTSSAPLVHVQSLEQALRLAAGEAWIIGGSDVYNQTIHLAHELWITHIDGDFSCDRFFPAIDKDVWIKHHITPGRSDGLTYAYTRYIRHSSL